MRTILLSSLLLAGCGDMSIVDVNTDVGKKDIDRLEEKCDQATAQMQILEDQNNALKKLLEDMLAAQANCAGQVMP